MINGTRALQDANAGLASTAASIARQGVDAASRRQATQQQSADIRAVAGTDASQPTSVAREPSPLARDSVDLRLYARQIETAAVVIQRTDAALGSLLDTIV